MTGEAEKYAVRLQIDYPDTLDRVTTFFRLIWIIPVAIILSLLTASGGTRVVTQTGETIRSSGGRHHGRPRGGDRADDRLSPAVPALVV